MTPKELQQLTKEVIESKQGCKVTELVADARIVSALDGSLNFWADGLQPLIDAGEIIEIEYVLPNLDYRIKSFLLPRGTEVSIAVETK